MKVILAHNHYNESHLSEVVDCLKTIGAPIIKCYELEDGIYQAVEGCHRLRACEALNIQPKLQILSADTEIENAEIDFDGCGFTLIDIGDCDNYAIEF